MRELAIKQGKGATTGYEQLKTDVQTVIAAMRSHRSALGGALPPWSLALGEKYLTPPPPPPLRH